MAPDHHNRATGVAGRPVSRFNTPFGVPLGDLGWFATLVMSLALGAAAFFLATFVAIMVLLFTSGATHHAADYALSYRRVGAPAGTVVGVLTLVYLGTLWVQRIVRRA